MTTRTKKITIEFGLPDGEPIALFLSRLDRAVRDEVAEEFRHTITVTVERDMADWDTEYSARFRLAYVRPLTEAEDERKALVERHEQKAQKDRELAALESLAAKHPEFVASLAAKGGA